MPSFIVLGTFQRASGDPAALERAAEAAGKLAEQVGGKVESLWLTIGTYDLVAVVEAPDVRRALSFLVAFQALGPVSTLTLAAEPALSGVLQDAQAAQTNVGGGGGQTNVGQTNVGGAGGGQTNVGGAGGGQTNVG